MPVLTNELNIQMEPCGLTDCQKPDLSSSDIADNEKNEVKKL